MSADTPEDAARLAVATASHAGAGQPLGHELTVIALTAVHSYPFAHPWFATRFTSPDAD